MTLRQLSEEIMLKLSSEQLDKEILTRDPDGHYNHWVVKLDEYDVRADPNNDQPVLVLKE